MTASKSSSQKSGSLYNHRYFDAFLVAGIVVGTILLALIVYGQTL